MLPRVTFAPATESSFASASKCVLRSAVALVPSLFQFVTELRAATVPGSSFRSRSSENRSTRPKPFDSDVPALEPDVEALRVQSPESVGDPVVLFDQGDAESAVARDNLQQPVEVGVVVDEGHRADAPSAAFTRACVRREP